MPKGLELAVANTDDDIQQYHTEQKRLPIDCKACGHRWRATLGEMMDDPTCRGCGQ
jgi:hypothetical protein